MPSPAVAGAPATPKPAPQADKAIAKNGKHISVKQSSSKQDSSPAPELDAKTKELVLNARKRTTTGASLKSARSGKGAPIVFTMDDVVQVLAKQHHESTKAAAAAVEAAAKAAAAPRKQEIDIAEIPQEKRTHSAVSLSDILGFNPAAKKPVGSDQEVPRKWQRYHKALVELRDRVSSVLEQHTADTLKRSNRDDSGDLSGYGQHMADAGTDTFDRDFALSMVSSEQEALFEINEAIRRINNGTYGVCEITGEPISAERLEAVPFTRYSLEGQKELEKTKRQKAQRGGVFSDNEDNISFDEDDN